jgi:hypothetical protein
MTQWIEKRPRFEDPSPSTGQGDNKCPAFTLQRAPCASGLIGVSIRKQGIAYTYTEQCWGVAVAVRASVYRDPTSPWQRARGLFSTSMGMP